MSDFRLPRLNDKVSLVDKFFRPTTVFIRWWQSVVERIEAAIVGLEDAVAAILAAQAAAEAAQASAEVAQAAAVDAQTAAEEAMDGVIVVDERTTNVRQFWALD